MQFIAEHNNIEIKDVLQKYGFDSVKDGGELVVFDSSQIKSADPVTYDDNGNVIPLSQRFNSENEDIRYSLPESVDFDSLIDAVSRGEMSAEEAKRLSKSNKLLNPVEIANTPKSAASTTPKLDEPKMQGEGDGESNLHGSLDRSAIITDEVKEKIKADTYIKNYGTTHKKPVDNYKIKGCFTPVKQPFLISQ